MTEIFGPVGDGWGFEILESEILEGGPLTARKDGETIDYGVLAKVHTVRLKLWYRWAGQIKHTYGVGHTPFVFANSYGVQTDWDYEKKSITDALSNALRYLGVGGDVFMGLWDLPGYVQAVELEEKIEAAGDSEVKQAELRHEFEDWYSSHMEVMAGCKSIRELELLFKGARPRVEMQGTPEQKEEHMNLKNRVARDLMKPKGDDTKQEKADD